MAEAPRPDSHRAIPDAGVKAFGSREKVVFKDGVVTIGKDTARKDYIPRHSEYKVYLMPDDILIRRGHTNEKLVMSDLDPGWYRIKIKKIPKPTGSTRKCLATCNFGFEFLVGMTESEFRKLSAIEPTDVRAVMTTDNGPEYRCAALNCDEVSYTPIAAVLHKYRDHFNMDPLKVNLEDLQDRVLPSTMGKLA